MKRKIWVTVFAFISTTMLYSMEKEWPKKRPRSGEITSSDLPKKYKYELESGGENMDIEEPVGSELLGEEEYNQQVNEALSTFAYNKEKKRKARRAQIDKAAQMVMEIDSAYFNFMPEQEYDSLRNASFSWLKLPLYKSQLKNEATGIYNYLEWKNVVNQKEKQLEDIIWSFIQKYPDKFV